MNIWTGESNSRLLEWLCSQAKKVQRLGSVCTGAFVLAEAGLLWTVERRPRTVFHWEAQGGLSEYTSGPRPDLHSRWKVVTPAGVAAGIDLCLC
jgi:transcriptional regulator GlxA family with amidase domain